MATRRERVVIELEDGLTAGVLREAGAVAVLNRELDKLGRESTSAKRNMDPLARETMPQTTRNSDSASKSIDKLSGRLGLLVQGLGAVGPAAVPIGAVAIPAVSTLASGLGFLTVGAGTTILAFHGLGDALTKFNKASAEPTATNIAAAQTALDKIAPSAQEFVLELHKLGPELTRLQQAAGSGLFPGLTEGIKQAQDALPAVERIFHRVGAEMGNLSAEAGKSLGGRDWAPFLKFIGDEAPHALGQMGHALGSVTHGLAELWMATQPLNSGGLDWIEKAAQGFDHWATGLDKTQGFQDFVAYIRTNGPLVETLLKNTGNLFVDLVKDAAPLGGPTLQALDDILKVLDLIAASPLGPPLLVLVQALSVARLTMTGLSKATGATFGASGQLSLKKYGSGIRSNIALWRELNAVEKSSGLLGEQIGKRAQARSSVLTSFGKGALALGAIGVVSSGVTDKIGATNTAMDAMAGAMVGGVPGAIAGGLIGALQDYHAAASNASAVTRELDQALAASQGDIIAQAHAIDQAQASRDAMLRNHQSLGYDLTHPFESIGGAVSIIANGQTSDAAANAEIERRRVQLSQSQTTLGQLGQGLGATFKDSVGRDIVPSLEQLQQVVDRVSPAMQKLGITWDDLNKLQADSADFWRPGHSPYDRALGQIERVTKAMDSNKGRTRAVSDALDGLSNQMHTTEQNAQTLSDALGALFNPKMSLSQAHNAWYEALHGLNGQLANAASESDNIAVQSAQLAYKNAVKDHGKHSAEARIAAERLAAAQKKVADATAGSGRAILGNSDAALKNQDAIRSLTGQMLTWIQAQADAGKSGKVIQDTYKRQRDALIETATQLGINKKDLETYLKTIGFTPKAIHTLVDLNTGPAERALRKFLHGRVLHVAVRLDHLGVEDTTTTGGHVLTGHADGGTIGGAPRRPYGDKVIIVAAPGEEIISNRHGQADRFRSDRASGRIPAYADGGTVATARTYQRAETPTGPAMASRWTQRAPEIDYGRLTQALLAARPLYGPVAISGDPTMFRLQMDQDRRRAALGSVAPRD